MTALADLTRPEMEELARLYRADEAAMLTARANVARDKADRAKARWRRESERTTAMAREAGQIGARDHYRGESYRQAMADVAAQRGVSRDAERAFLRAEKAAQAAERALKRAVGLGAAK